MQKILLQVAGVVSNFFWRIIYFMKVLFIDSGIGGLTTLAACVKLMPRLKFIYYADDKYSPYGSLTPSQIAARIRQIILSQKNIGMVVLACNTATVCAIDELRKEFSLPIVGTEPAIRPACKHAKKVLVLSTPATSYSSRLNRLCKGEGCVIEIAPMPNLAKVIDGYYLYGDQFCEDEIDKTICYIKCISGDCSCIVLGCTHYVHLSSKLGKATGKVIIDGNFGVAKRVKKLLYSQNFSKKLDKNLSALGKINYKLPQFWRGKFVLSSKNRHLAKKYAKIFGQTLASYRNIC